MTLTEMLTVITVLGLMGFIIFARLSSRNPKLIPKIKEFFADNPKPKMGIGEHMERIYPEKRQIM